MAGRDTAGRSIEGPLITGGLLQFFVNCFMHKSLFLILLCLLLSLVGCQPASTLPQQAENELDAARLFIRLALDGKFDEAKGFMLQDSVNNSYLDITAQLYQKIAACATRPPATSVNVTKALPPAIFSDSYRGPE